MRLSECRGQACLNYAEREHLRRSQLEMRNCHTGCKNREIKNWKNYLSWQLTIQPTYYLTTTNLLPYHYEPTILPLRTYHLTTTSPRSTKGRVKEHLRVRPRWVYGWDTDTCMGEIPTPVWVRHLDSRGRANGKPQDRFSANPNGAPWVIWNKIGWKCVMLRVIPNEEWVLGVRNEEWGVRCEVFSGK